MSEEKVRDAKVTKCHKELLNLFSARKLVSGIYKIAYTIVEEAYMNHIQSSIYKTYSMPTCSQETYRPGRSRS